MSGLDDATEPPTSEARSDPELQEDVDSKDAPPDTKSVELRSDTAPDVDLGADMAQDQVPTTPTADFAASSADVERSAPEAAASPDRRPLRSEETAGVAAAPPLDQPRAVGDRSGNGPATVPTPTPAPVPATPATQTPAPVPAPTPATQTPAPVPATRHRHRHRYRQHQRHKHRHRHRRLGSRPLPRSPLPRTHHPGHARSPRPARSSRASSPQCPPTASS